MTSSSPGQQHGQVLPLALVLLVAVAATTFYMFNSGQLVQEKLQLTNTADAVAYSAGVFEARMLNYDAYTNRAIIANQIAIGQAVGLASWAKYMGTSADNIGPYLYLIPYVGPALKAAMDHVASIMEIFTPALAAAIPLHDTAIQALALSQQVMHGPGDSVALGNRLAVMQRVARENDPEAVVDPVPISDDFIGFTRNHESREERRRMGRVVSDSRESFLRSRNWNFGLVVLCTGIQLRKRGGTELIDLADGWKSMDTLSAHRYRIRRFSCRRSERPIGYGTAFSEEDLADSAYSYSGSRSTNPRASRRADSGEGIAEGFDPAPSTIGGGAIPTFKELSSRALEMDDPVTQLTIRVTKATGDQRYSGGASLIRPPGRLELYDGAHSGGQSAAAARVEVFFERPDAGNPRHPDRNELGSLFNPYWQVRLAPITPAERLMAQLRQGGLQLP
ncbi:pilus assembly protein TadG-related protein [Thauera sp. 63]|uniref:pilus assembly protein TadG-related protein n=1 Tax=Thauera sp. 63 TaxID=497321 RepID=UPI000570BC08|nr:pilus assembly protein TadG-related protein [Thauera sp. 63]